MISITVKLDDARYAPITGRLTGQISLQVFVTHGMIPCVDYLITGLSRVDIHEDCSFYHVRGYWILYITPQLEQSLFFLLIPGL
jgi:hypothetical protein